MTDYYDSLKSTDVDVRTDVIAEAQRVREELHESKLTPENPDYKYRSGMSQAIYEDASLIPATGRLYERRDSQFEEDTTFSVDEEVRMAWESEYSEVEIESLEGAKSEEHMVQIKKYIEEDRKRASQLSQYGTQGVLQTVAVALLDPPALVMSMVTGGYGNVAAGSKAIRALKLSGVGAAELGSYEAIMSGSDTQKSIDSVYSGLAMGGIIGFGIGRFTRAKADRAIKDVDSSITADANRASVVSKERTLQDAGVQHQLVKDLNDPNVDHIAVQNSVNQYHNSLKSRAKGYVEETKEVIVKGKKVTKTVKRKVPTPRTLQSAIKAIDKKIDSVKSSALVKLGGVKKHPAKLKKALDQESKLANKLGAKTRQIEKSFESRINALKTKAKQFEADPATKAQAKFYKAQDELDSLMKQMQKQIDVSKARATKSHKELVEELQSESTRVLSNRNSDVTRLEKAKAKLEADVDIAKTTNQAKSKLRKWDKMTPEEKALEANKGVLPIKNLEAQAKSVDDLVTAPITEEISETGTAGAQRVGATGGEPVFDITSEEADLLKNLMEEGASVDPSLVGTQIYSKLGQPIADRLQALHTTLSNSKSFAVRGLNHILFESAQGGKARAITASAIAEGNRREILGAMRYRLTEGFEDWIRSERGSSPKAWKEAYFDPRVRDTFNKQVMLKVENPALEAPEGITKAADGIRDLYKKAGEIRKASGEAGFENLKLRDNYMTKVVNPTEYKRVVAKLGATKSRKLLSKGYQEGHFELEKAVADRLAQARHIQLTESNLTLQGALSTYGEANVKQMVKDLKSAGVDDEIVDSIMKNTLSKELQQGISNRAKKSLDPSLTAEVDGVRFVDIVDNNLPSMVEGYARESAGNASLSKVVGTKTPAQMDKVLNMVEKSMINSGTMTEARIAEEVQMLKDGVEMILGKSINKEIGSPLVRGLSRLRDVTGLLRLQSMGLAAIPETARATTSYGLGAVLESIPNLGLLHPKNLRKGGKMSGHLKQEDLRELDEIMSYYGDDWALHDASVRYESFEDLGQTGKLTRIIDTALAQGRRVQGITSGFRAVQGGGEKIALRSLAHRMKKQLLYGEKPLKDWQINDAGWSKKTTAGKLELVDGAPTRVGGTTDDFLTELQTWMRANPKQANVNGRKVDVFNFEKMPPKMQERLRVGMQRLVYRDMQRMNVGETSTFMNKWLGQTMFQFRSFPLASVEKQLVHDLSADKIHAAQTMMASAGFAYMAMAIQTSLNSVGRDDDYFDNNMTGVNAVVQLMGRMGQTSALSLVGDGLATLGLLPDDLYSGQGRMGYRAVGADYLPVVGVVGDVTSMANDLVGMAKGDVTGSQVARDIQNLTPFMKTIGVNQAISAAIKEE